MSALLEAYYQSHDYGEIEQRALNSSEKDEAGCFCEGSSCFSCVTQCTTC